MHSHTVVRASWITLLIALLIAGGVMAQTPSPDRYANLPQGQTAQGFPTLGFPSALIDVVVVLAFDHPASVDFFFDGYPVLLERVRTGEVRVIALPQVTGVYPNGRAAARAGICAAAQNVFWDMHDALFQAVLARGDAAFTAETLASAAVTAGADRAVWSECLSGSGVDLIVNDAQTAARELPDYQGVPYITVDGVRSLTGAESLRFTLATLLERANAAFFATLGAPTPTPDPEATPIEEVTVVEVEATTGDRILPPIEIALPPGWGVGYDVLILRDLDAIRGIPVAVYQGQVTGGIGTIILLWGFPNLVAGNPFLPGGVTPDLWTDGTRLLRLAVFEQGCNIGTDLRRTYSIGGVSAIGTQFAAVGCPELADTRGWFGGLRQYNINYLFYAFSDPIAAAPSAETELQAILDSVRFLDPVAFAAEQAEAGE